MGNIFLDMEEEGVCYGLEGLKILIYGGDTLGKTPQAMRFPKPVLFMAESGGSALKGMKMPIMSKKDFTKAVADLTDPKTLEAVKEKVKTIVIDTVEDVVELFKAAVCAKYGVEDVGQVQQAEKGNPNGYNLYRTQFKKQINLLTSSGYTVIFISHEETIQVSTGEFDDRGNELTRPFIIPKGSAGEKDSCRFIKDLCDFRFYISSNGIDKETKKTVMSEAWCVQTDKFYAGSRFNTVPVINPFTAENVIKEIEEAQKRTAEDYSSSMVAYGEHKVTYTKDDYISDIAPYVEKLAPMYPDLVREIIDSQLGEKARVSQATDDQLTELEAIFNSLVDLATERGIYVDRNVEPKQVKASKK